MVTSVSTEVTMLVVVMPTTIGRPENDEEESECSSSVLDGIAREELEVSDVVGEYTLVVPDPIVPKELLGLVASELPEARSVTACELGGDGVEDTAEEVGPWLSDGSSLEEYETSGDRLSVTVEEVFE